MNFDEGWHKDKGCGVIALALAASTLAGLASAARRGRHLDASAPGTHQGTGGNHHQKR